MIYKFKLYSFLLPCLVLIGTAAAGEVAGKAVIVKGRSEKISARGVRTMLKEGMSVESGDAIATSEKAAVKLVLKDMTEMSVGPASKFIIEDFQKDKPSMFSVMFGSLRAKVSKSVNGDVKAIIRTKSSTMGVRGTEFQTVYNEQTQMTSLVTFEGAVAMVKSDPTAPAPSMDNIVRQLVNPDQGVTVSPGQFSGVAPGQETPTVPVRISPAQLDSLRNSNPVEAAGGASLAGSAAASQAATNGARIISPVPPGVDARLVVSSVGDMQDAVNATLDPSRTSPGAGAGADGAAVAGTPSGGAPSGGPPPEGFYNATTGQMAPPAGGFVDMSTGLYIPPPPGSAFDPIAGVYVPPPSMGSFNLATGTYVPPAGFTLDATRGFVAVTSPAPGGGGGSGSPSSQGHGQGAASSAGTAQGTNGLAAAGGGQPGSPGANTLASGGAVGSALFPGMNPASFGTGMIAALPPPGSSPAQIFTGPGVMPPPAGGFAFSPGTSAAPGATNGTGAPAGAGMQPPGGYVPSFNQLQPMYPVYNPFVCPPYCDPQTQPGAPPPPASSGPSSTTGVNFNIT